MRGKNIEVGGAKNNDFQTLRPQDNKTIFSVNFLSKNVYYF
jgi:hypothetical protein